ncbi:CRTAC1 family protein [Roseiconus nitratireducens]|uniref:CRTAC1 family protein n=1 Tax=Roseiconus nitratireducens TaxID=2605748 RepID=UPI001375D566|nr:CRTAC1 family protein [Roseiconus nitratireducens]
MIPSTAYRSPERSADQDWRRFLLASVLGLLCLSGCGDSNDDPAAAPNASPQALPDNRSPDEVAPVDLTTVEALARSGNFVQADQAVRSLMIRQPDDPAVWELAGDIAVAKQDTNAAIDRYQTAADQSRSPALKLLDKLGRQWMNAGRPFESVRLLERIVTTYPDDLATRRDLAGLLSALALQRRAAEQLRYLVQHGQAGVDELVVLTDLSRPQTDPEICNYALKHAPQDPRPLYSLARKAAYEDKWTDALDGLRKVWEFDPKFVEASAFYGRALVQLHGPNQEHDEALQTWLQSLPPTIEQHPQYWVAAGLWAEKQTQPSMAASAFARAVALDENDGEALNHLAINLAQIGFGEASQSVAKRAALVAQLRAAVDSFFFWRNRSQRAAVEVAKAMSALGRPWEAASWARLAVAMPEDPDLSARDVFDQIRSRMDGRTPWQEPAELVSDKVPLSDLPDLVWNTDGEAATSEAVGQESQIRFMDQAAERGLRHVCAIAPPADGEAGLWIYQSGAGGAGVIDMDLDGWPDFYLSACDGTPQQTNSSTNRLFRNLDGRFRDCTDDSGTSDLGFTQGIAVGDINSDGFPDLYVANFGRNQLLQNNGDGTFTDVTNPQDPDAGRWTTSVAIADIDGDALADLFDANYVGGDDVLTRQCFGDELDVHRSCGPLVFPAEPDQVHQGQPDGGFVDRTDRWLGADGSSAGRGLGLVVGDLAPQPGMEVYVANDMSANHFWAPTAERRSASEGRDFQLVEQGAARGLAFNERSLAQASMGIAANDADGDGDLDFLVTHFTDEYNTLYVQIAPGLWADRTTGFALARPTEPMLAYGTQWLDADGDGNLELLVANGNVDDFSHNGHAYRMPMQMFARRGDGRFVPLKADGLGDYFVSQRLGRALVTVDADCDGRTDALVTHLFDPVSLLINQTPPAPDHVRTTFQVVGTRSHRDAIGTTVELTRGGQTVTRQLTAGDGYQCSQQRRLIFDLLATDGPASVTVTWPDGSRERLAGVKAGGDYLVIQGESEPHRWVLRR